MARIVMGGGMKAALVRYLPLVLLALAWDYRAVCLRVFAGQLAALALGLGVLSGSGLAVDVVRRAVDPSAPPVRWPFGLTPPAGWAAPTGV